jgi:hypothetical protein
VELFTAELELDDGRVADAERRLQPIATSAKPPFQSVALAYLAKADLERKRYAQAIDAIERAQKDAYVAKDSDRQIQLLGLATRAYAATGSPKLGGVTTRLEALAAQTKAEGNIEALLGVRLALAESDRFRNPPRGRRELSALASEAEHRGFLFIAHRAQLALR